MKESENIDQKIDRINGQLYQTFIIKNDQGAELQRINVPLKVEIKIKDILEILVGASVLAVPVAFTEEVWNMGDYLPWFNVILLSVVNMAFLGSFIYFSSYRRHINMFRKEFFMRVVFTFILSLLIVGLLLTIVDKCPWFSDFQIALKRIVIGAFPASMSATVTDNFG